MGKSAKRKSLSPSEKLNNLKDFLSRHEVPLIVFRILPHVKLEHRTVWTETWHLKEMTENDIQNTISKYISDEARKTLELLIFWVRRETRSIPKSVLRAIFQNLPPEPPSCFRRRQTLQWLIGTVPEVTVLLN
jgi:hypothetical protein